MAHQKIYSFFCQSDKKIGAIFIHSHQAAIVVLAVVPFLLDSVREKRPVPLTKQSGIACFKNSRSASVGNHGLRTCSQSEGQKDKGAHPDFRDEETRAQVHSFFF